jgi:hypothetical protein
MDFDLLDAELLWVCLGFSRAAYLAGDGPYRLCHTRAAVRGFEKGRKKQKIHPVFRGGSASLMAEMRLNSEK